MLHFNRVPTLIAAFCRRWFAIPVQHFFDDFRVVEPAFLNNSGYKWFGKACSLLGWTFDPDKDQLPAPSIVMLGNIEDWSRTEFDDTFYVLPTPKRLAEIKDLILLMLFEQKCSKAQ